ETVHSCPRTRRCTTVVEVPSMSIQSRLLCSAHHATPTVVTAPRRRHSPARSSRGRHLLARVVVIARAVYTGRRPVLLPGSGRGYSPCHRSLANVQARCFRVQRSFGNVNAHRLNARRLLRAGGRSF